MTPHDNEITIFQNGNPFSRKNRLVCVGIGKSITYKDDHFGFDGISGIPDRICGFNIKFDLHWDYRAGIDTSKVCHVWDEQLAHFILTNQQSRFPSLNEACARYGIPQKLDFIKLNYWDKGIDTDAIPREELTEYLTQDLAITEKLYYAQREQAVKEGKLSLINLHCADLLTLVEMERHGLILDTKSCEVRSALIKEELEQIDKELKSRIPDIPIDFGSRDHVSAYLYGGIIKWSVRESYLFRYKDPKKQPVIKERTVSKEAMLPAMVRPLEKTENKKSGYYSTDEKVLRKLVFKNKRIAPVVDLLLRRAEIQKLYGTYYEKLPKLIEEMDWPPGKLHGSYNQVVAVTGRLSSSNPNLQNNPEIVKQLFVSEYD